MKSQKNKVLIVFVLFFFILIVPLTINHYYNLKLDYSQEFTFVVAKKEVKEKGDCNLFDKKNDQLPLKSYKIFMSQVYEGDSIVKKSNSYFVFVYRKINWRDYGNDDSYFVAEKINLN